MDGQPRGLRCLSHQPVPRSVACADCAIFSVTASLLLGVGWVAIRLAAWMDGQPRATAPEQPAH
eukprot:scaffold56940_cov15-Tisochrysis_lutea.AAC.1